MNMLPQLKADPSLIDASQAHVVRSLLVDAFARLEAVTRSLAPKSREQGMKAPWSQRLTEAKAGLGAHPKKKHSDRIITLLGEVEKLLPLRNALVHDVLALEQLANGDSLCLFGVSVSEGAGRVVAYVARIGELERLRTEVDVVHDEIAKLVKKQMEAACDAAGAPPPKIKGVPSAPAAAPAVPAVASAPA